MARKPKESPQEKAKQEAKGKDEKKAPPRLWTVEQRREAFLEARKKDKPDFHILDKDFQEALVPYGNIVFDEVLRLKGIARHGRVTQFHGDEGAGKTTTALWTAARYQKITQEPVAIFEYEPAASAAYAYALGVDPEYCYFEQPTNLEEAIKRHVQLMEDRGVRFFVNDSIPYMQTKVPRKDIESGKVFKSNFGLKAKGITRFYEILRPYLLEHDAALLIINQTRDRISDDAEFASKWSYTNKIYSLPGGRMARFTPSVMVELTLEEELRPWTWEKMPPEKEKFLLVQPKGDVAKNYPTANRVRVRALKNKVTGAGFREGHIYIRPNFGIDENMSIRELACVYNLIAYQNPTWYAGTSPDNAIVTYHSKKELVEDLVVRQNPEVLAKLKGLVVDALAKDDTERFSTIVTREESTFLDGGGPDFKEDDELEDISNLDIDKI